MGVCKQKVIELYLVMSPYLDPVNEKYTKPIDERMRMADIPHFDYSHFAATLGKQEYFSDEKHLNRKGSELFTRELIANIKTYRRAK